MKSGYEYKVGSLQIAKTQFLTSKTGYFYMTFLSLKWSEFFTFSCQITWFSIYYSKLGSFQEKHIFTNSCFFNIFWLEKVFKNSIIRCTIKSCTLFNYWARLAFHTNSRENRDKSWKSSKSNKINSKITNEISGS